MPLPVFKLMRKSQIDILGLIFLWFGYNIDTVSEIISVTDSTIDKLFSELVDIFWVFGGVSLCAH